MPLGLSREAVPPEITERSIFEIDKKKPPQNNFGRLRNLLPLVQSVQSLQTRDQRIHHSNLGVLDVNTQDSSIVRVPPCSLDSQKTPCLFKTNCLHVSARSH
jgi:hypothetical protein